MERLTKKNSSGDYYYRECFDKCGGLRMSEKCNECEANYAICKKLGDYEDLEERLNKVYGDCDGLLSRVVEMLEKHPCIDMANNTSKSRLLTDEDVDKWDEYKRLERQDRLIKIPLEAYCIVNFEVRKGFVLEVTYHISRKPFLVIRYDNKSLKSHSGYLGNSVFLTKSEAEAKLKELKGNNE